MFNRKVMLIALLAVVLLGSLLDGAGMVKRHKQKRLSTAADSIVMVYETMHQASLTTLMNQIASHTPALDSTSLGAGRKEHKPPRSRAAMDSAGMTEMAGYAKALDPAGRNN